MSTTLRLLAISHHQDYDRASKKVSDTYLLEPEDPSADSSVFSLAVPADQDIQVGKVYTLTLDVAV